ncbi:4-hydroxyphenylpyruvate dioxygenase family protein, partial [Raoultella ornithinolytica]
APVIKGIGDCMLYLVDRYGSAGSIYDGDYEPIAGADLHPVGFGLTFIDHLTHNLYFGNMQQWSDYYERLFNFREIRYFDIKGLKTGLVSKAMTAPDGIVRIPLNESSDPKSQINEYLDAYKGEGIQHIACFTENIYETVEAMRAQGVDFLDTPETYFDVIDQRVPNHGEDVPRLAKNKILIDADPETHQRKLL